VATTVQVQQVNFSGNSQIAGSQFASVANSELSRVANLVLRGHAWAVGGLVCNAHSGAIGRVLGANSHNGGVVDLVEDGKVSIVVASRLQNSVDVTLVHGDSDFVAHASTLLDVVAGGETNVEVLDGKNTIQADLWCSREGRVDVDVEVVFADVLLELAWDDASVWAEAGGHGGLSEVGGESGLGEFHVQVVAGVPRLFAVKAGSLKVGLDVTLDRLGVVVVVGFHNEVHAIVLVLELELDLAEVIVLVEEIVGSLSEVVKFWWSHF